MARFYANENFPFAVVEELRKLGHDVLTVQETGKANCGTPDDEVLAFAIATRRAVLTLNRKHFLTLHRMRPEHCGILVCTFDPDFAGQARRIHESLHHVEKPDGRVFRVNRPS